MVVVSSPREFTGLPEVELFVSCLYCQSIRLLPKANISIDFTDAKSEHVDVIVVTGESIKSSLIHPLSAGTWSLFALS